jgi:CRP-like cAMP-binding protein
MVMKECSFEKGSEIWKKGEDASFCILIISGQVKHTEGLPESSDSSVNLKAGAMVGDFAQMLSHSKCLTTLEALKDVVAYKISSEDLVGVLHRAPGISLFFQNCYFVL